MIMVAVCVVDFA